MDKAARGIRTALESDIGYIVKIGAIVVSALLFIILPQKDMEKQLALQAKDIATINTNHLSHIQDSIRTIEAEISAMKVKSGEEAVAFARHDEQLSEVINLLKNGK